MDERYPEGKSPLENFTPINMAFGHLINVQAEKKYNENVRSSFTAAP